MATTLALTIVHLLSESTNENTTLPTESYYKPVAITSVVEREFDKKKPTVVPVAASTMRIEAVPEVIAAILEPPC